MLSLIWSNQLYHTSSLHQKPVTKKKTRLFLLCTCKLCVQSEKKKKRLVVNEYILLKLRSTQHVQQTLSRFVKYKHAVKKKGNCKITLECNARLHSYHTAAFSGQKKKTYYLITIFTQCIGLQTEKLTQVAYTFFIRTIHYRGAEVGHCCRTVFPGFCTKPICRVPRNEQLDISTLALPLPSRNLKRY